MFDVHYRSWFSSVIGPGGLAVETPGGQAEGGVWGRGHGGEEEAVRQLCARSAEEPSLEAAARSGELKKTATHQMSQRRARLLDGEFSSVWNLALSSCVPAENSRRARNNRSFLYFVLERNGDRKCCKRQAAFTSDIFHPQRDVRDKEPSGASCQACRMCVQGRYAAKNGALHTEVTQRHSRHPGQRSHESSPHFTVEGMR